MMACTFSISYERWNWQLLLAWLLVPTATAACIFLLTPRRSKLRDGKTILLPPIVRGLPIIGCVLKFFKEPVEMARKEYEKLGAVFTCKVFNQNVTFLVGPEVCRHFYTAPETSMSLDEVFKCMEPMFGSDVLYAVDFSVRSEQMRFLGECLRAHRMKAFTAHIIEETEEFLSKWSDEGEVDIKAEFNKLLLATSSRCLFGLEVRQQSFDEVGSLLEDLTGGFKAISLFFPYLPIEAHRKRDRAAKRLKEIFSEVIEKRKAQPGKASEDQDMLEFLMNCKYTWGRSLTNSEITGLLLGGLFGGHQTSTIAASWAAAFLSSKEKIRARAQLEQLETIEKHGKELNHNVIRGMKYLESVVKECIRMYPPSAIVMRYCTKDFAVESRGNVYTIPQKHWVVVSPAFAGRLEHVFTDPDSFDPERFLPGREEDKKGGPFSYLGFGAGTHPCLGQNFAYMQIKTIWCILLRKFDLKLVGDIPTVVWDGILVGPKGEIRVRYKRRELSNDDVSSVLPAVNLADLTTLDNATATAA